MEEYLELIHSLQESKGAARTSELSEGLNVGPGTVTNIVARMEKKGLVEHRPYQGVRLTRKGHRLAAQIVKRHRLSERLLSDILKVPWSRVHELACKLEHAVDDEVAEAMEKALGEPETCPHGNPIVDVSKTRKDHSRPLSHASKGYTGMVTRVIDERENTLKFLSARGLVPGASVSVIEKEANSLVVSVGTPRKLHNLSLTQAESIFVRDARSVEGSAILGQHQR